MTRNENNSIKPRHAQITCTFHALMTPTLNRVLLRQCAKAYWHFSLASKKTRVNNKDAWQKQLALNIPKCVQQCPKYLV